MASIHLGISCLAPMSAPEPRLRRNGVRFGGSFVSIQDRRSASTAVALSRQCPVHGVSLPLYDRAMDGELSNGLPYQTTLDV